MADCGIDSSSKEAKEMEVDWLLLLVSGDQGSEDPAGPDRDNESSSQSFESSSSSSSSSSASSSSSSSSAPSPSPSPSSPSPCLEMDAAVWSKLPEDFLERVLVRLPLVTHLRFRAVCKQWRATLSSPAFLHQHRLAAAASPPPICLCQIESGWPRERATPCALPASSPSRSFKLDLSFLPRRVSYPRLHDHGLICFRAEPHPEPEPEAISIFIQDQGPGQGQDQDVMLLCVCNPLTRTWRELVEFATPRSHQLRVALAADAIAGFQVVVLHGEVSDQCQLDRNQGAWSIRSSIGGGEWKVSRGDPPCPLLTRSTFALCRGRLFVLVFGVHFLLYALDGRLLHRFHVHNPCMHHAAHRLVEHRGEVFLCGHYRLAPGKHLTVRIWRLEQRRLVFQQVAALPEPQVMELVQGWDMADADVELLDCRAVGECICLHLEIYNLVSGVVRNLVLAFHCLAASWTLCSMEYLPYKSLTLFEPRLDLFI